MPSDQALKLALKNIVRRDLLACLDWSPSLPVAEIMRRTGRDDTVVRHHLNILETTELVAQQGEADGGEPIYVATLDEHPNWVRRMINEHRVGRKR